MLLGALVKRSRIPLEEKLAAALWELAGFQGQLPDLIYGMRDRRGSADELISLFDFDHVIFHSHGGKDRWWNLTPMLRAAHREKTARTDIPAIAKGKRIQRKQAGHEARLSRKISAEDFVSSTPFRRKHPWPSRPFPKKAKR